MIKFLIIFLLWCSLAFAEAGTVTVTSASTSIVAVDTQRTGLLIKNIGTTTCYITEEATADTNDFELSPDDVYIANGKDAKRAVNGITSSGTTTEIRVWETKS